MLSFTEADFPEEVLNRNVIGLDLVVAVYDNYEGDNEETNGVGCVADPVKRRSIQPRLRPRRPTAVRPIKPKRASMSSSCSPTYRILDLNRT